ncbi:1-aminocyclopropane-1-carboxylate deaminase [Pseudonocardia sp. Ae168_Ps1]|uniref:1-aminocyclopropane-1-carboxylate deaminase/D-cysteine desulfhydrase n=1 Tax=unclassified Pseudonocardia TaxID=2619320 RepID=UPI00095B050C|nr:MULTISPECIES: pyridoxal-phosphate dependent enzyme [unclassified Pseudonocardia]OLL75169.1 1-aminocyclopropane-1-carboxylate deaminase [Pseudonocardia sp. Ae150A_Ps1]OLL81163.1 1-aminocyclopropane-1-carboxylate deaminase [Pseudonocardia sp. Ae168_Ps1]OLL84722.1 1-aminocyclopropane-1-carboxylate deaminase [Pseudonocardia sp. Ae263_Ps1]OLL95261.1 1-aminocyclopropane-1-carboxylate deaminase [Pseudonocardia sp. Ae356_Ps1]
MSEIVAGRLRPGNATIAVRCTVVDGVWEAELTLPTPLVEIRDPAFGRTRVLFKRDDLLHPDVPGNKWRKLKYLVRDARERGAGTLLTFGGAHSNHVRAVAAVGERLGLRTIGVIRGEERPTNPGLRRAEERGMVLHYLDRSTYRRKTDPDVLAELHARFGDPYVVPEGGTSSLALPGLAEMVRELDRPYDAVVCAVGTGGTVAGIAAALPAGRRVVGISALRGAHSLDGDVDALHRAALGHGLDNWTIEHRFHCGGFARRSPELDTFLTGFRGRHGWAPDRVYVGKALLGLVTSIGEGRFAGETVVLLVSGPAEEE